jgi:hypothetical protein
MNPPATWNEAAQQIADKVVSLCVKKHLDYGVTNITDFGEFGVLVRLNDKVSRLKNLYKSGKEPNNESLDDTWLDVIGYGIIGCMLRDKTFDLPMGE